MARTTTVDGVRVCADCRTAKPVDEFRPDRPTAGKPHQTRRHPYCVPCQAIRNRQRYQREKEKQNAHSRAWHRNNPERARENKRRWYKAHPEASRGFHLRSTFQLSLAQYETMAEAQGGKCAICDRLPSRPLVVDHDHACCPGKRSCGGCVRGLLCITCNSHLGWLERLGDAIESYRHSRAEPS